MPSTEVLTLSVDNQIATLTLNRPESRNALSRQLLRDLHNGITDCETSDDVSVIVLTGVDPAFCAGLDLKELGNSGAPSILGGQAQAEKVRPLTPFPARRKPMIGAVNGTAVTGGLELALNCDILIASDRARFADTHARVGIQPAWGLTILLPQAIGIRRAREMSATGNYVNAGTALAWGLVNRVVPHEALMESATELARDIAGNDQPAVRRIFETYSAGTAVTAAQAWQIEAEVAAEWLREGHGQADDIEQRRRAVTDRGHSQIS